MSKKIPMSIYLSKKDVATKECLDFEDKKKPAEIQITQTNKFNAIAYIGKTDPKPPVWFDFLKDIATTNGKREVTKKEGENSSISGILIIEIIELKRCFIFCFGHGKKFLKYESIEKHFGRNVVLNTADEENIISVRTKSYEGKPWFKELQSILSSNLYEFDFDCQYELLQKVAAELEGEIPNEFILKEGKDKKRELLSRKISGYESVNLNANLDLNKLIALCKWLAEKFASKKYKNLVPNIDVFDVVKEESLIKKLNAKLETTLKTGERNNYHLIVPEKHDIEEIDGYSITGTSYTENNKTDKLNIDDYIEDLMSKSKLDNITIKSLKDTRVTGFKGDTFRGKWSLYRCITGEMKVGNLIYAIMDGGWYQINSDFFQKIVDNLNTRVISSIPLDAFDYSNHKNEAGYNSAMAKKADIKLYDRDLQASSIGQGVEPCDLLYKSNNFIHIKRLKSSADLSHLYGQGIIANELFLIDDKFRNNFLQTLTDQLKTDVTNAINDKKYNLCFGIIIENRKQIDTSKKIQNIPVFSILNLQKTVEAIEKVGTGIKVKVQLIPVQNKPRPKVIIKKKK